MVTAVSRRTALAALVVPFAGSLASCARRGWDSFPETSLSVATGNRGGVFVRYGQALIKTLNHRLGGVEVTGRLTDASLRNLRLVDAGTCDIGFSLGDAASDAVRGVENFSRPLDLVALARLYDSFLQLVVLEDSPVQRLTDLRGLRVGIGAAGSGTRVLATRVLAAGGLRFEDVESRAGSLEESTASLLDRGIDAFFFVSGLPSQAIEALSKRRPIRLIDLEEVIKALVSTFGPEYVSGPIPTSTYDLGQSVTTVSVKNYLVVRKDMPARLAYAVTRVMFEAQDEIARFAPNVRQPSVGAAIFTSPLGLHRGALGYFREVGG